MPRLLGGILWLAALLPLGAGPPDAIAIRGARVVTVSGGVIDSGTVLLRDGLIEDAGANLLIPKDAWLIEGEGLVVYPGLFDALSTIGIPEPAAPPAAASGRGQAAPAAAAAASGPEDRPSNTSWLRAADLISPQERRLEAARNAGFTTAAVFPTQGIFAGQGAVISLAGSRAGEMIVASPVGLYLNLSTSGSPSSFPNSLMGVLAYIRQVSSDADHYQLARAHYQRQPRGAKRPAYDRAIEGLLDAPRALFPASRAVDIERVLRFAAGLRFPPVLYGAHEAYAAAEAIARARTPVLVSLKWPERSRDDPERVDSLRTLEARDRAPSAPAALARAGVAFAFYSDGLAARDLKKNVRRAIAAGLSEPDAVRALTLAPATIYGLADRLGSIEKGKIANLVVTDGPLFGEQTRVKYVFVDGVKFEPAPEAPAADKVDAR